MIDIHAFRKEPKRLEIALEKRGEEPRKAQELYKLDEEWRKIKAMADEKRAERNKILVEIAKRKKNGEDAKSLIEESKQRSKELERLEEKEKELREKIDVLLLSIPNIPHESVPVGEDETKNVEIRRCGKVEKESGLAHYEIGEMLKLMDFERGVKLGGHRFVVLWKELARLERALINFMLEFHTKRGYTEVWVPHLVKTSCLIGSGQLPKFEEDLYKTSDDLWLIPTAEVSLVNLHANEILKEEELPKRYVAYTPCYRREAGAYGKDIKGMIRQHQFDKVELVRITKPEDSYKELEELTRDAEAVLQTLNLPYRVVELCTGDLGFAASKTYDIEVWLPGQGKYREISSCSNCEAFQARRAKIRMMRNGRAEYVHTLNGSGLAIGRTLIAIIENYCRDDGIEIPKVLVDYTGFDFIPFKKG